MFGKLIDKKLLSVQTKDGKLSLFALALPLFFSQISSVLMSFVQTIVAKRYEQGFFVVPVTIAATGNTFLQVLNMTVGTGASILLSAYLGAGKKKECEELVGTALILSLLFSCAISFIGLLFAEPLLNFMGMKKAEYAMYRPYALTIYKLRLIEFVVWLIGYTAIACLRCYGHTKIGFWASFVSNIVNLVGVVLFLFVFEISKENASLVFAFCPIAGLSVFSALGLFCLRIKKIPTKTTFNFRLCRKIFSVGIPANISQIFYQLSQIATTSICTNLPPTAYLAKTYISQIVRFTCMFGYSIGQANSVMVGRLCGMGEADVAYKVHMQNLKVVVFCNVLLSTLCAFSGKKLLQWLFGASGDVLAFSSVFYIDIAVELGRGMNHVGEFGLNSTGDVKFTTTMSVLSCWLFSVGLSYLFVTVLHRSLNCMWIAFAIDELLRGVSYLIRWKKQTWKKQFEKMMSEKNGVA